MLQRSFRRGHSSHTGPGRWCPCVAPDGFISISKLDGMCTRFIPGENGGLASLSGKDEEGERKEEGG
ncbi:unnamed protein product [Penicillium camemberti]|uniref:Str. FM013 n=1 Tax=Penicillium camemberti (strain FM 013) TaxID=1429867 RepID=A0A0G4NZB3_PENC3|nr:unnamed protein product [Penicillium camemberti]